MRRVFPRERRVGLCGRPPTRTTRRGMPCTTWSELGELSSGGCSNCFSIPEGAPCCIHAASFVPRKERPWRWRPKTVQSVSSAHAPRPSTIAEEIHTGAKDGMRPGCPSASRRVCTPTASRKPRRPWRRPQNKHAQVSGTFLDDCGEDRPLRRVESVPPGAHSPTLHRGHLQARDQAAPNTLRSARSSTLDDCGVDRPLRVSD